ncbi:MAG: TatD family hydrolase [Porticoccaceae bacterium]|nr:TatD family hydrolase [Porticoccaceae bacterium]
MTSTSPLYPLIDIGLNLASNQFADDASEVLNSARQAKISACILTGTDEQTSEQVLELCRRYAPTFPGMLYCTAGLHPHDAKHWRPETTALLKQLLAQPETVAVGETGLDFNRDYSPRPMQEQVFEAQIALSADTGKPLFMHERDAHQRQFEILRAYRSEFSKGVIHCFTGDQESLFNYLDLDLHIGITGWICDERRGSELASLVKHIPLNRLMLETDAPYLLPRTIKPKPASRRNEPAYLPWVLQSVAENRPESAEDIATATRQTSIDFFGLNKTTQPAEAG